jgi:MFS family permease
VKQSVLIILATAVMSLALGYTMPLLAITLKAAGATSTQIGISAAAPPLAILLSGFVARRVTAFYGFRVILCLSSVVLCGGLFVLSATTCLYLWFITRAVIGCANGMLWISLESWLTHTAPATSRGRVVGIYAAATTLAFACGSLIPVATRHPSMSFLAAAVLFGVGVATCLFVRAPRVALTHERPRALAAIALSLVLEGTMAFTGGILVSMQIALLPTLGLAPGGLAGKDLLSATLFGAIAAQLLTGVMADRWGPERMAMPLVLAGIGVSIALQMHWPGGIATLAIYFCWGGLSNALYSLALTRLGMRKRGQELLAGNAALLMAYETGTLIGPVGAGMFFDLVGARAFSTISIAAFALLVVVIGATQQRRRAWIVAENVIARLTKERVENEKS